MNPFITQVVVQTVLSKKKKKAHTTEEEYSKFEIAKGFRELKIMVFRLLKDVFLIALGIFSAAFGLESFLLPSKFIDGGATGISLTKKIIECY